MCRQAWIEEAKRRRPRFSVHQSITDKVVLAWSSPAQTHPGATCPAPQLHTTDGGRKRGEVERVGCHCVHVWNTLGKAAWQTATAAAHAWAQCSAKACMICDAPRAGVCAGTHMRCIMCLPLGRFPFWPCLPAALLPSTCTDLCCPAWRPAWLNPRFPAAPGWALPPAAS